MASKCKKITQKWPKRDRDSNPGFLCEKLLPYHLSHDGVVNKVKLIHGATHISFVKFFAKNLNFEIIELLINWFSTVVINCLNWLHMEG